MLYDISIRRGCKGENVRKYKKLENDKNAGRKKKERIGCISVN